MTNPESSKSESSKSESSKSSKPSEQDLIDLYETQDYPQITIKPWGKEILLQANRYYAYKRIYINAGFKTSYQVHEYKVETNYIIDGTAEVWEEDSNGNIVKEIREADYFFHVPAGRKHRVIAITDIILQEVSLPYLSDCIRLEDDTNRGDGRIEKEHSKPSVVILAAGKGTRMGAYSTHIHKTLLPINNKAILTHIIEKFPIDYQINIAVGYKKEQIQDYCSLVHSDRKIRFIEVDNYEHSGSGPGYSIKCCKEYLQGPFYICVSDCYLEGSLPNVFTNWLGYHKTDYPNLYSTFSLDGNNIKEFKNKDTNGFDNSFTGFGFISDYEIFWNIIDETILKKSGEFELVSAFYDIKKYNNFKGFPLDWYDVGTYDKYIDMKNKFEKTSKNLYKNSIQFNYRTDKYFIKYFDNISNLTKRASILEKHVPKVIKNDTYLCYEWVSGDTLYQLDDVKYYTKFLDWFILNLKIDISKDIDLTKDCRKFYFEKTMERVKMFKDQHSTDSITKINGKEYESIDHYLNKINFDDFSKCLATKFFHGDLQFDNIIYDKENDDFKYIDWRPEFGSNNEYGDVYYDLAKLYGGLILSYDKMRDSENFSYIETNDSANFKFNQYSSLTEFKSLYEIWLTENGFDLSKVKTLVAIIFLNMSPLHDHDFGKMLFCLSKTLLADLIC